MPEARQRSRTAPLFPCPTTSRRSRTRSRSRPSRPRLREQERQLPLLRLGALAALATGLGVYSAFSGELPGIGSWPGVALVSLVVLPATFGLVWLALPAWRSPYLLTVFLACGGLAAVLEVFDLEVTADLAKLAALTAAGWFFLRFFEEVGLGSPRRAPDRPRRHLLRRSRTDPTDHRRATRRVRQAQHLVPCSGGRELRGPGPARRPVLRALPRGCDALSASGPD